MPTITQILKQQHLTEFRTFIIFAYFNNGKTGFFRESTYHWILKDIITETLHYAQIFSKYCVLF